MSYRSLAEMFLLQANRYGKRELYRFARDGRWGSFTWEESLREVREIALGLLSLGVKKGDRAAIFSANRVEWSLIDWANICLGVLTVPIYSSSAPRQVFRILSDSEATVLFIESAERFKRLDLGDPPLSSVQLVVLIEPSTEFESRREGGARFVSLERLQEMGRRYAERDGEIFDRAVSSLQPDDDLTIIYTSGTTGDPKGVLTTHRHYLFMLDAAASALGVSDQEVNLQFLPLAHSLGRLEHWIVVACGFTCGFARSIESIANDLQTIRPTVLISVPRIYENAYNRIRSRVAAGSAFRAALFNWSESVGRRVSRLTRRGEAVPWKLRIAASLAHRLVFSKIHALFGGRLRLAISGGAPLSPEIAEFFHAMGVLILEGYGLTETSTVSHVNRPQGCVFGTVGMPLNGVECRIAPDGEILLRGPNIFKCYFRDQEATRQAVDPDGWFYTGDVGQVSPDGFLRITDRKKDLIVTSGGTKVAPQMIENFLKTDPLIHQAMVIGDTNNHLAALVTLNRDQVAEEAKQEGVTFTHPEEMAAHPWVTALLRERIRQKNKELAPYETVRSFRILAHEFAMEKGELTPTLKLRRQVVVERYKDLIAEMYRKSKFDA
jgi:long-chain acyl-CoA synthetase